MQGRRLSEDEKRELREMLERGSTREVPQKQKKLQTSSFALAAFICSVLPFAPYLLASLFSVIPVIGWIALIILLPWLVFFPLYAPLSGILGTSLAIISIKREQRGSKLTSAAIILGLLAIGIGSYTLILLITDRWLRLWSDWGNFCG